MLNNRNLRRLLYRQSAGLLFTFGLLYLLGILLPNFGGINFSIFLLILVALLFFSISLKIAQRQYKSWFVFKDSSALKFYLSGLFSRTIFATLLAIYSAIFLCIAVVEASTAFWCVLLLSLPSLLYLNLKFRSRLNSEIKHPFRIFFPIYSATWTASILATLLIIALELSTQNSFLDISKVAQSNSLNELLAISNIFDAVKGDLISVLWEQDGFLGKSSIVLLLVVKKFSGFFAIFSLFEFSFIAWKNLSRGISPTSEFATIKFVSKSQLGWASAVFSFFALAIWFPTLADVEHSLSNRTVSSNLEPVKQEVKEKIKLVVDRINGENFKLGTYAEIEPLLQQIRKKYDDTAFKQELQNQVKFSFNQLEPNIDIFLDQYYSLTAEYVRIGKMLSGDLENYLQSELNNALKLNDPFKSVILVLENEKTTRIKFQEDRRLLMASIEDLIRDNKIMPETDQEVDAEIEVMVPELNGFSEIKFGLQEFPELRWGSSSAMGAASAAIGVAISKKLAAKGLYKALGKALTKVVAKKVAGTGVGAAIGGVIGSVVPGAGNVALGVLGGLTGAVLTEFAFVSLEEIMEREKLKKQILEVVRQERTRLLDSING